LYTRITGSDSHRNGKTDTTTTVEQKGRGVGDDDDLYFVPSDEETEDLEEEEENDRNNNNLSDTIEENTTGEDDTTRTEKRNKDRITEISMKERTIARKKKMKVTQDNFPFGHVCDDIALDDDTLYMRVYCQNVSGIFNRDGIGLDLAFKEIKQASADIFTFNETHGDESNATARKALRLSKQRMWKDNNEDCKIVHSSSIALVIKTSRSPEEILSASRDHS
jgi:hypothetical protein